MTEYGNKSQTESRTSSKGGGVSLPPPPGTGRESPKGSPKPSSETSIEETTDEHEGVNSSKEEVARRQFGEGGKEQEGMTLSAAIEESKPSHG